MNTVSFEDAKLPAAYHSGPQRATSIPLDERYFIAWDGEGMNLRGPNKPQNYVLFGASTGDSITSRSLNTFEILDLILRVGKLHPAGIHVGFAFNYDTNMIVQSLSSVALTMLHRDGWINLNRKNGSKYCITVRPSKSIRVSRYDAEYDRKTNPNAKCTVTIYDIFTFFGTSFVKAAENLLGADAEGLDVVREGKKERPNFKFEDMEYVKKYWVAEIEMVRLVAEKLRKLLYSAGLRIREWHGPGALATYANIQHSTKLHMAVSSDAVRRAARYAYAAGRFELFKAGRIKRPIHGIDINSAYPYAISQLPDLTDGFWHYTERPRRVASFGVYHIRFSKSVGFDKAAGPLFHRDHKHNISFPWLTEGWYWSPEAARMVRAEGAEIVGGWEFIHDESKPSPFAWVRDTFDIRREWKAQGIAAEWALKLLLNSLYGKMAQRVGYDEKKNRIPPYHQLEWAGWVTSYCRSMLYHVIRRIPWPDLIAVETDGIYTTMDPADLGITASKELGGWSIDEYDELMYIQSGLAWLHSDKDGWVSKRRGLDADTFTLDQCTEYTKSLGPGVRWDSYRGQQTRFITLGAAVHNANGDGGKVKGRHCVWRTSEKRVLPGEHGKRVHMPHLCGACDDNATAWEAPHDLVIRSLTQVGVMSAQHSIPWEGMDDAEWRDYDAAEGEPYRP